MEEKEGLMLKIRLCMRITWIFAVVLAASVAAELLIIRFAPDASWAKKTVDLLGILAVASPFGILAPLFFRVNYQNRLLLLERKEKEQVKQKGTDE